MTAAELAEKLEELKGLLEKATPAPWRQKHHAESELADAIVTEKDERGYWSFIARTQSGYGRAHVSKSQWEANAALIVWLVNNTPALISATAARLRSMEEALKEAHEAINLAMTIAQGRFPATARKAPLEVLADAERKARAALAGAVRTSRKTLSGEGQ